MTQHSQVPDQRRQRTIDAIATFAALMHAYEKGQATEVAKNRKRLNRLGVKVRLTGPESLPKGGYSHV